MFSTTNLRSLAPQIWFHAVPFHIEDDVVRDKWLVEALAECSGYLRANTRVVMTISLYTPTGAIVNETYVHNFILSVLTMYIPPPTSLRTLQTSGWDVWLFWLLCLNPMYGEVWLEHANASMQPPTLWPCTDLSLRKYVVLPCNPVGHRDGISVSINLTLSQ